MWWLSVAQEQVPERLPFYETGEFWLAVAAIIIGAGATVIVALMNIRWNKQRDQENRQWQTDQEKDRRDWEGEQNQARFGHEVEMLTTQLDREKGVGRASDMHKWIKALRIRTDKANEFAKRVYGARKTKRKNWVDWGERLKAVVESAYPLAEDLEYCRTAYIDGSLGRVAWTDEMRECVAETSSRFELLAKAVEVAGHFAYSDLYGTKKGGYMPVWSTNDHEQKDLSEYGFADRHTVDERYQEIREAHRLTVESLDRLTELVVAS